VGGAFDLNRQLIESLSEIAFQFAESVYAPDETSALQLKERLGVQATVIEEPINLSRFTTDGALAFAKDVADRIVIVARAQDQKISAFIRDTALAINEQSNTTQFLVLAEDITSDDDEFHAQDSFKGLLKEPAQIIVSRAYHELLPELLRSAPIVFVAPGSERLPHIWLESMACERAVIASEGGDLTSRYLTNDVDCIVVKEFDAQSVCKTFLALQANSELRTKLARQAALKVQSNYDRKKLVAKLEDLYKGSIESFASAERKSARALAMCALIERTENLVMAYDKMLYDFLFSESREFRLKHWLNKMSNKNGSSFGQKLLGIFASGKQ
jgi:glycosyltransferase involved in cell wall biosynthesis